MPKKAAVAPRLFCWVDACVSSARIETARPIEGGVTARSVRILRS